MSTFQLSGRILDAFGKAVPNAQLRLLGDLTSLGADPHAVVSLGDGLRWERPLRSSSGNRWHCYVRYVRDVVAGLSFAEFKTRVVAENPHLAASGYRFQADQSYRLPSLQASHVQLLWDRPLSGFSGGIRDCWKQYVAGKLPGLTWVDFQSQVMQHNPNLAQDRHRFVATKSYLLPRHPDFDRYERFTQATPHGRYTLGQLPPARYQVAVSADGMDWQRRELTVDYDTIWDIVWDLVSERGLDSSIAHTPVTEADQVVTPSYVTVQGMRFMLNGQPFKRFIGLNIQGLAHYGYNDIPEWLNMASIQEGDSYRRKQLEAAHNLGARVIRLFLALKNRTAQEIGDRLDRLLTLIEQDFPDLFLIIPLTNLYTDLGQIVHGTEHLYAVRHSGGKSILTGAFFQDQYQQHYLPFVEQIVTRFQARRNIFAWEPGNELMYDPDPALFIRFMQEVTQKIKGWDPNHLVTTGMKSIQHTGLFRHEPSHRAARRQLCNLPTIDFITVHRYTRGGWEDDPQDDQWVDDDIELAREVTKPIVVEEAGIVCKFEDGHVVDLDYPRMLERHMKEWFEEKVLHETAYKMETITQGFMQWGFTADSRTGDGDKHSGLASTFPKFAEMCEKLTQRAQQLQGELL